MKKIVYSLIGVAFFFSMKDSNAQFWKYEILDTLDGVEFRYKLVHEERFDKESPLALSLKIRNTNDYKVNIKFGIDYFWEAKQHGFSEVREFCLLPTEMMAGKLNDLAYEIKDLTNEQIESDDFSWSLTDVEITKVKTCGSLFIKEKKEEEE